MDPIHNISDLQTQSLNTQRTQQFHLIDEMTYISVALVIFSIASNSFTLVVLRTSEIFHEIDLILYRLLAVEDMTSSIITLTSVVLFANMTKAEFRRVAVPFFRYCVMPFFYQTIGVVLTISICRYLMIVRPLRYSMWVTRRRIIVSQAFLIVMSFVLSYLLTLLTVLTRNDFVEARGFNDPFYMIPMAIGFLVQVSTGSHILYISVTQSRRLRRVERAVFHQDRRRNGPIDPDDPDNNESIQEPKRRLPGSFKGLKTVLVIIGSYWVAWFPIALNTFKEMGLLDLPEGFRILASTMILVNSCWNPLIYYLTNRAFRDSANGAFRRMKSKICQLCKRQAVAVVE